MATPDETDYIDDFDFDEPTPSPPKQNKVSGPRDANVKYVWNRRSKCPTCYDGIENEIPGKRCRCPVSQESDSSHPITAVYEPLSPRLKIIHVRGPQLMAFLMPILEGYQGWRFNTKEIFLHSPFFPLVHRWKPFCDAIESEEDPLIRSQAESLGNLVLNDNPATFKRLNDILTSGFIAFDYLWMIFGVGDLLYYKLEGKEIILRCDRAVEIGGIWTVRCEHLNVGRGGTYAHEYRDFSIHRFIGEKPITELQFYPLRYHPQAKQIQEKLSARGKRFVAMQGCHKAYHGLAEIPGPEKEGHVERAVTGRIMIDALAYEQFFRSKEKVYFGQNDILSEDDYVLFPPVVRGYSFATCLWGRFLIDKVREIEWDDHAIGRLVLPSGYKETILSLARSQYRSIQDSSQMIQGKGHGLTILLTGEPGTGKSFTAESVAEHMRVPLLSIRARQLGRRPDMLEGFLENLLEIASRWKAIFALDDFDPFLRHSWKGEPVSVFAQIFEENRGIIFLTSNQLGEVGKGLESRIHIHLSYPELDRSARLAVWLNLISSLPSPLANAEERDLDTLAEWKMNGRDIEKVMQAAQLLASDEEQSMGLGHIQTVLRITQIGGQRGTRV